jgi:hypothetical protein
VLGTISGLTITDTLGAKHALLREGIGWGNMPLPMIEPDLVDGTLVRLVMPDHIGGTFASRVWGAEMRRVRIRHQMFQIGAELGHDRRADTQPNLSRGDTVRMSQVVHLAYPSWRKR